MAAVRMLMMLQVILMQVRLMLWLRLMMDYVMILMNLMYLGLGCCSGCVYTGPG